MVSMETVLSCNEMMNQPVSRELPVGTCPHLDIHPACVVWIQTRSMWGGRSEGWEKCKERNKDKDPKQSCAASSAEMFS